MVERKVWVRPIVLLAVIVLGGVSGCGDADTPAGAQPDAAAPQPVPPGPPSSAASPARISTTPDTPVPTTVSTTMPKTAPTMSTRPVRPISAAPIDRPAAVGAGVVVSVVGSAPVETAGVGPGESAGESAVAVTLRVTNRSASPVDLLGASVTLASGPDAVPGSVSEGPPARPWSGQVAPGSSADGVYVFVVDPADRADVVLHVAVSSDLPAVVLQGALR